MKNAVNRFRKAAERLFPVNIVWHVRPHWKKIQDNKWRCVAVLPLDGSMALDDMDCFIIKTALERADNNLTAAARALGATRETLRYRVRKYNLKIAD